MGEVFSSATTPMLAKHRHSVYQPAGTALERIGLRQVGLNTRSWRVIKAGWSAAGQGCGWIYELMKSKERHPNLPNPPPPGPAFTTTCKSPWRACDAASWGVCGVASSELILKTNMYQSFVGGYDNCKKWSPVSFCVLFFFYACVFDHSCTLFAAVLFILWYFYFIIYPIFSPFFLILLLLIIVLPRPPPVALPVYNENLLLKDAAGMTLLSS